MSQPESSDGRRFEKTVADSLKLIGWRVQQDQEIGGERIAIVTRQRRWNDDWLTVVECRDGDRPLGADEARNIHGDYGDLLSQGLVHEVLIISSQGLTQDASDYISSSPNLSGMALSQIVGTALDFTSYLEYLIESYDTSPDGLPSYYIPPKTVSGSDLEDLILRWIAGDTGEDKEHGETEEYDAGEEIIDPTQPAAILGAYGLGKSSFSTHLAATLAKRAQQDETARIPVLIRLSEVANEQTLEGLLGKHFTATHQIIGYTFSAFQQMNREGRFVIILDGFDEMKQLLTWKDFKYNFEQLNKLHDGDSRVMILGRPTAFANDAEHQYALHGWKQVRKGRIRESDWPDYDEVALARLSAEDMKSFLQRYLKYRESPIAEDPGQLEQLWERINSRRLRDIARRPVQLRMLAQILPSHHEQIDELGLVEIYDIFIGHLIDEVIDREKRKDTRVAFTAEQRRRFLADLAFWLWQDQGSSMVVRDLIPDGLVEPFADGQDLDGVRRDLVVGSPLDRRPGEQIKFPHRSFQEFMVAQVIWEKLADDSIGVAAAIDLVTEEVADFMHLQQGRAETMVAQRILQSERGELTWRMIKALFFHSDVISSAHKKIDGITARSRARSSAAPVPWEILLLAVWTKRPATTQNKLTTDHLRLLARQSTSVEILLTCLFCLLYGDYRRALIEPALIEIIEAMLTKSGERARIPDSQVVRGQIVQLDVNYVMRRSISGEERSIQRKVWIGEYAGRGRIAPSTKKRDKQLIIGSDHLEIRWIPEMIIHVLRRLEVTNGGRSIGLRGLRTAFVEHLPNVAFVSDWNINGSLDPSVRLHDLVEVNAAHGDVIQRLVEFQHALGLMEDGLGRTRQNQRWQAIRD
jgi:hypothetical protein